MSPTAAGSSSSWTAPTSAWTESCGTGREASIRVLVLCGGRSAERDVSCVSAATVLRALKGRHRASLVWIDPGGRWRRQRRPEAFAAHPKPFRFPCDRTEAFLGPDGRLRWPGGSERPDVVFPVLHGPYGEDGTLQGFLEMVGAAYVGSGVLGSSVGMDKEVTKRLALQAGLPVLPYAVLSSPRDLIKAKGLKFPVFVKPLRLGSSVGVYKVEQASALAAAVRRAFRFDIRILVEQGVPAREIECAVIGGEGRTDVARAVGEIRPTHDFYSYEAKYLDPNGARLLIPADLSAAQARSARKMAARAFEALGCHGLARADFLMDKRSGKIWFNEINTMPGCTAISMFPKLWEASGAPFPRVVDRLLALAVRRHRAKKRLRITRD